MRVRIAHLQCEESQRIFARLMSETVFYFMEHHVPDVARSLFGQSSKLEQMRCVFNSYEPTINIYHAGGDFMPHQDNHQLTVLVHLSADGAFTGGGTAFWPEARASEWRTRGLSGVAPEVVMHPSQAVPAS